MSTTIVKADLGRIPGFVYVLNDIVYLVVNSQMGFSPEAIEREAKRVDKEKPAMSYLIQREIGEANPAGPKEETA